VVESAFGVKRAYYQLYFQAEKIRVNREVAKLLHELEDSARAQNEAGKGTLQDVLRIQMDQDRLQTEFLNLEHSRAALLAQFKAALGLKVDDSTPPLPSRFESASRDLPAERILETAIAENKRLKSMDAEIRSAAASITLARRARLPDFSLGFMADVKANPTLYRFPGDPGTISLPIWRDKIAAQIAEAQFNKRSAEARLSAQEIALGLDFVEKWHVYQETSDTLDLLENQLLPKARQSLEFARANYPSGQTDFASIAEAGRALLNLEMEKVDSTAQREIVLAELSLIVQGMSPTSGSMTSAKPMSAQPTAQKPKAGGM
jgi:outer membrane protein TolC